MAIDVTGNPWIINAADVTALPAVAGSGNNPGDIINISGTLYLVIWRGPSHIYQVEFMQYTTAATDTAKVTKYNGKNFWDAHAAGDLQTVRSGNCGWTNDGITVPNNGITSGLVKIYHK